MGSVDKLIKALENLKVFQPDGSEESAGSSSKKKNEPLNTKDKIINCNILADCMCAPSVRSAQEFPKFLGVVIETLLSYANDKESDVRMVSDECLNRITRVLLDTNLGRLQIEFFKELKKNGPSRCVRSALWRFAELSSMIRLHKRRAFVVNLLPCVVKMAERHEEALQESLMAAMPNIASALMVSASDAEVKSYLAPFLNNLCSTSAVVRRVASTCTTVIILHTRKPLQLFNWLLVQVLDMVLPIMHSTNVDNMPIMLGCLHCIRHIIPLLEDEKVQISTAGTAAHVDQLADNCIKLDTTIMLFELMIHCLQQSHPSVITAALECYQQLLKTPTLPGLVDLLLTPGSISTSVLAKSYETILSAMDKTIVTVEPELSIEDSDSNVALEELQGNLALAPDVDQLDGNHASPSPSPENGEVATAEDSPGASDENTEQGEGTPTHGTREASPDSGKLTSDIIGSLTDSSQSPILYSARLLCHSFLLTGNTEERLYADREVRVSIKSLALSCLYYILKYLPQAIQYELYVLEHCENQHLSDILLYHQHTDPQIQGMVAQVVGVLVHARVHCMQGDNPGTQPDLETYFSMLMELLDAESSMTTKLTISALRGCINTLLNSGYHQRALQLLDKALVQVNNSYWLVKSELLDLISELDMLSLVYLSGPTLQDNILENVVLRLLGDSDHRVRQSASSSLVKLIPQLFYGSDHPHRSVLLARANTHLNGLLYPFLSEFPIQCPPLVHALPHPYHLPSSTVAGPKAAIVQSSLSKIIYRLLDMFSSSSLQYTKLGVCHALYELSETYPVTKYPYAWSCSPGGSCAKKSKPPPSHEKSNTSTTSSLRSLMMDELRLGTGGGPLTLVLSLLTHSPLSLDLGVHQDLLSLAGNLLAGACLSGLKQGQSSNNREKNWSGIYDRLLVPAADRLFTHIIKLLNIFSHVLEDTSLVVSANPKAVLDAAREAITSPIKKRVGNKQDTQANENIAEPKTAKEAEKVVKSKKEVLGSFSHIPFYVKLHEAVKGAHFNYKVSLSLSKLDKFGSMLHQILVVFSQLLEVASLQEIAKCADEILHYLKPIMLASPVAAIRLVHQLLKALFGTNLSSQYEDLVEKKVIARSREVLSPTTSPSMPAIRPGLFTSCLATPYSEFAQSLAHNPYRVETEDHTNAIYVIKKCEERKIPLVLRPGSGVDKNTVGAYIRLFEPLVIKALRMYTSNCSVYLQTQVLGLLVQLIQLRVNYCLLDNDGVYLGFLVKQVDMISEGPPREQAGLIRCIFQLLLLLSYEKLHSKTLVVVPTIIQLCDGVIASGQNPTTHAIPALEMLVKDLFLCRSTNTSGNSDTAFQDIETQREVTASMLLRLIHHTKVIELLSIVLYQLMRESEEKWKKLSRQVLDLLLPLATKQKIDLESREALFALHNILLAVSPSVYRPVDMLLKALFTQPTQLGTRSMQQRWLSTVLAIIRVLLSIGKEEVILSRLNELEISFDRGLMSHSFMTTSMSSLAGEHLSSSRTSRQMSESSESMISSSYGSVPPQELLASFLTQIVGFCTERLHSDLSCPHLTRSDYEFSVQQFSLLLLFTSYMLQSGHFRKVARFMTDQLKVKGSHLHDLVLEINAQMIWVGKYYPTLTLQWSYILMLLNYDDQNWWRKILKTPDETDEENEYENVPLLTIHEKIIKCTGLAMYCDYVVENVHDSEHLTWLTVNHVSDIIDQLHESPVNDFMSTVFANASASGLFISAIQSRYNMNSPPTKLYNVVTCLCNMHKEQSGAVVVLLVDKMICTTQSSISRLCDSVACRRLEVLLCEEEQVVHRQLMAEDVIKIIITLQSSKRVHRRLLALVEKLRATFYPSVLSPLTHDKTLVPTPDDYTTDKDFYLFVTRKVCNDSKSFPRLCASLLGSLEVPDTLSVMSSSTFQLSCLAECIKHGSDKAVRSDTGTPIHLVSSAQAESSQYLSPLLAASETTLKQVWEKVSIGTELSSSTLEDSSVGQSPEVSVDVVNAIVAYLTYCPQFINNLQQSELQAICFIAFSYFDRVKVPADDPLQSSQMTFSWTSHVEDIFPDRAPANICHLYAHLSLLSHIFKDSTLTAVFADNPMQVFTVIDSLTYILKSLSVPGLSPELENYRDTLVISQDGYIQISQLVTCLSDVLLAGKADLPPSLIALLNTTIRGLARLPCVNEHARMPVSAFVMSSETREDNNKPQLKVDALQDTVVLREFIKRNNLLGWISRHQFEETWACLLHLLSPVAITGTVDIAEEDDVENIEWMVSALRGITGLLTQSLNRKQPGNTLFTCYKNVHRQRDVSSLLNTKTGEKLYQIRLYLSRKSERCECIANTNLFCINTERVSCDISYNQLSIDYLTSQLSVFSPMLSSIEKADMESAEKSSSNIAQEIDTASCLKLLIDVYSHLLSANAKPKTPLMLLNECVKSIVMLSDLFYEKSQFTWMFSTLYDLHQGHHHGEDELMNQYVVLGLCKSAAMQAYLKPQFPSLVIDSQSTFKRTFFLIYVKDSGTEEKLSKLLEVSFKSTHIPTRIAAISGALYLMEAAPDGDLIKSIFNTLVEFISRAMDGMGGRSALPTEFYALSVWSLSFYLIERFQDQVKVMPAFIPKVIQTGIEFITSSETSSTPRLCSAVLVGFERLLLVNALSRNEAVALLKLASDRLALPATHVHIHSILGLLVTCMYTDISQSDDTKADVPELKMEIVSLLFDRIRKGLPHEAEIITGILPTLMSDLFSSQDIMNKVIGEFLSEQQPHPTLIARMVYEVFEEQAAMGGQVLLQDWVLLSITSFTQRSPLAMAIWSLSCFFLSVSSNHWLKGLFPFVASRIGILDQVDEMIFLLSCKDFYSSVSNDLHKKQTFITVFQSAARHEQIYRRVLDIISVPEASDS